MQISLKAARVNAGKKQSEVAEFMGVSQSALCMWENGKYNLTARQFLRLCELYGVSPADVFLPKYTA